MAKLATICGAILVMLLSASTLAALHFPYYQSIGLTLFGAILLCILGLAARLAIIDNVRGDHHDH